ncbi:hypothetical protein ACU4GI_36215 [Cupriavidus basilensis]|nr:hypothetical protein [Cupriavidus basilensis]MDF3884794.1 hypothetical protein [Cupriavidus basilensis]
MHWFPRCVAWQAFSLSETIMLDVLILMASSLVLAVLIFKG